MAVPDHECDFPDTCPVCRGPSPRPEPVRVEVVFPARYDGQCPECDLPIRVGEDLAKLSDGRYVHPDCIVWPEMG